MNLDGLVSNCVEIGKSLGVSNESRLLGLSIGEARVSVRILWIFQ